MADPLELDPVGLEQRRAQAQAAGISMDKILAYEAQARGRVDAGLQTGDRIGAQEARRELEGLNPEATGAPFKVRAVDSLMRGLWEPKTRLNYLKKTFGPDNVRVTEGGDVLWKDSAGEHPISGKNWEASDLGAVVGYIPELVGMIAGPAGRLTLASRLKGATAGGIVGDTVRQGGGMIASGESIPGDKSTASLLEAAASAGLGQSVGELGRLPTVNPAKLAAQVINKKVQTSENSAFAEEMRGMQERQNVPLSFYQETGSDVAKMLEGFAGRTAFGRIASERLPHQQNTAVRARAERFIEMLGKNPAALGDERVGSALAETGRRAVDDVLTGMQTTANEYFNFRSKVLGKDKVIIPGNWKQTLRQRAEEYRHYGDVASMKTARSLEAMADDPAFDQGMSPATIQHKLAEYNARSYGREGDKLFPTLDNAASVELTKKLHEALKKDLWEEVSPAGGKPLLTPKTQSLALQTGLKKYAEEADLLTQLKNTPILKLLESKGLLQRGAEPIGAESIPQGLREGMRTGRLTPSELRSSVKLLQAADPTVAHTLAGSVIQDALRVGIEKGATQPWKFDREAFAKALPQPHYLEALYGEVWNPGVKSTGLQISRDLNELSMLVRRSADKIGQGIPESPTTTVGSLLHMMLVNPISALGQASYKIFAPYEIATVMTNPKARKETLAWLERAASGAVSKSIQARKLAGQTLAPGVEATLRPGVEEIE